METMKLVIELQIGNSAVRSYTDAINIIRAQVGRANANQGLDLPLAKPEYGDGGSLIDRNNSTVGWWRVDLSGDQKFHGGVTPAINNTPQ
jgi:hypothetical protein